MSPARLHGERLVRWTDLDFPPCRSGRDLALNAVRSGVLVGAATLLLGGPAAAQSIEDIRDDVREDLRESDVTGLLTGIVNFGALPDIASANFFVEPDDKLSTLKLPFGTDLEVADGPVGLHIEGGVGYLTVDDRVDFGTTQADVDWRGVSGFFGGGPAISLGATTKVRPILDLVISYLENDADYRGADAELFDQALRGLLYDAHLSTIGPALALEVEHKEPVGDDGTITFAGRYTHLFAWSFNASDEVLEGFGQSDTFSAYVELAGPTPFTFLNRDVRWNGVMANTTLFGSGADALGFDFFFEFGGGLDLALLPTDLFGLGTIGVRAAAITGNNVTGWTIGLRTDF
jgi:hypothetical protein